MHENYAHGQANAAVGYASLGNQALNTQAMKQAASQAAAQVTDARISDMQAIAQRLGGLLNTMVLHNERLQTISDRLTGSELAKEAAGQPPRPVPNGHIALFNMALDEICNRLDRAEQLVSRIHSAV